MPTPVQRPYYSPQSPLTREFKRDSPTTPAPPPTSKSWSDTTKSWSDATDISSSRNATLSYSSAGRRGRRPTFSQIVSNGSQSEKKRISVEIFPHMKVQRAMFRLQPPLRRQLEAHIWAYAEMLLAWELPQKRAELLESARVELMSAPDLSHPAMANMLTSSPLGAPLFSCSCSISNFCPGIARTCAICSQINEPKVEFCTSCGGRLKVETCSICRLPVRGMHKFFGLRM